jgi:hypothetical protein
MDRRYPTLTRLGLWRGEVVRIGKASPRRRRTPARPPRWLARTDPALRLAFGTHRARVIRIGPLDARGANPRTAGEAWRSRGWPRRFGGSA